ncbi:MAG TPA: 2-C-methyl-D-erythritol 2,4-cyclodiphosphate synthase [Candidatus Omnitrophota bacterium]|jgi:2-C-methyl-D-erythritol 2,4-cyclodiphosphate synthase|nr:2-C-methyl-D-erythritol 2,4-cyclodiphosphate synthase [Candidatus Omnitrophota bacterium]HRZ67187.1 2-C-methyl-D-erythritol 2,4-cyclodiphosphate synthase [Candidatus Omnitrophota bacterium]
MRAGLGYDIHRLVEGRKLFLGGVEIPYIKGLEGYSDADVLLHAICDAILGAMGKDDIGIHFPNNDPQYKGISSLELLHRVAELAAKEKFRIVNVDSTLIMEEPKIVPFKAKMRKTIASVLGIEELRVNVKATTQEGVGAIGRGEAIAAYAIASVEETG